jgi:magnesium-transporting ATPase (P-type)
MITGDYSLTANAIAKRLGIDDVYSRISPMGKLEIVEKFKKQGDFIAVTGDGVNDTPALKAANIGIAMGSGTDIAKETGSMIIVDDNFSSIVNAVEEGRRAYNNIRKVIYVLLSTGIAEIIVFVFTIIFNLPIPLIAIQLLWLNLISDGIQGDALALEQDTENVMNKKVKNKNEKIFNKLMISEIAVSAISMSILAFLFLLYLIKIKKCDLILTRSYLLTFMVFLENIHIFNCRSENLSAFKSSPLNNKVLMISILITSLIQGIIVSVEPLANFFKLTVIPVSEIFILLLLTTPIILVMEIFKLVRRRIKG